MITEEIKQINDCGIICDRYGFVSKSGFDFKDDNLIMISINDMF